MKATTVQKIIGMLMEDITESKRDRICGNIILDNGMTPYFEINTNEGTELVIDTDACLLIVQTDDGTKFIDTARIVTIEI